MKGLGSFIMRRWFVRLVYSLTVAVCLLWAGGSDGRRFVMTNGSAIEFSTGMHAFGTWDSSGVVKYKYWAGFHDLHFASGARFLIVPYWPIVLILSSMSLIFASREVCDLRSRRRTMRGLCRVCGYDLRASGHRCPECGAVREETGLLSG